VALRDPQGEVEKLLCCARDITERKQAERALRRANEQLELLSRLKDEFLSMASHELKTPVTSIRMLSEIATRHPGKVQPEVMESLTRQSDQLVRLVNDLLDVSRFQLDRVRLQFERRDLRELLSEVCALSRDVYRDHPVHCQLPPEPILVQADSTRLIQVLQNLIDNAAKYSPVGSPVDIIVEPGPSQATIAINDQGAGIAPEDLPHIFERFYKPKRQQAVLPGLGLGLYISKEIVERHGGRIWAESELGKGSTFFVELPLAENHS
jgi:two-component system sensor histidine kinase VicK